MWLKYLYTIEISLSSIFDKQSNLEFMKAKIVMISITSIININCVSCNTKSFANTFLVVSFFVFGSNAKSFAVAFIIFCLFLLLAGVSDTNWQKFFFANFNIFYLGKGWPGLGLFQRTHWKMFLSVFSLLWNFVYAIMTCHLLWR